MKGVGIERCELKAVTKRRCAILDKVTFLDKNIKILNPELFMWT
jgi:hypothetical protein